MRGYLRASQSTAQLPEELDRARGRSVVCEDGNRLGHVVDILFDEYHTERAYLEVESDGFLNFNHKHFLTPVALADFSGDPIRVNVSTETIEKGPGHDRSAPFSEEYEMAVLGFWGTQFNRDVEAVRDPLVERPGELHSMRPEQFDDDPVDPHVHYRTRREED